MTARRVRKAQSPNLPEAAAAVSVSVPVVVIMDDADQLEPDLAVILVENLIERIDGHVLVVAAVNPDGALMSTLKSRPSMGLPRAVIRIVDADPGMDYHARVDLVGGYARICLLPRSAGSASVPGRSQRCSR